MNVALVPTSIPKGCITWEWRPHGVSRISLSLLPEHIERGYHTRRSGDTINGVCYVPYIAQQLDRLNDDDIRIALQRSGWGADADLPCARENRYHLVWMVCRDIVAEANGFPIIAKEPT